MVLTGAATLIVFYRLYLVAADLTPIFDLEFFKFRDKLELVEFESIMSV